METFYVTHSQFWDWFDRDLTSNVDSTRLKPQRPPTEDQSTCFSNPYGGKRLKTEHKPRSIMETEAATRTDSRYIILYGRHKPGKKTKTWEGDGYLSLVGQMAHLCDLRGRLLEEPTVLDEIDYSSVEELGELIIGNTEVQVVEIDKK